MLARVIVGFRLHHLREEICNSKVVDRLSSRLALEHLRRFTVLSAAKDAEINRLASAFQQPGFDIEPMSSRGENFAALTDELPIMPIDRHDPRQGAIEFLMEHGLYAHSPNQAQANLRARAS